MIRTDEEAKAAQEVAKATGKALDVASGAGTLMVNGTVGRIAAATLGLIGGDWVQEQQKRNLARIKAKTARILDGVANDRLTSPIPSVVKSLLEAAADESREELQDLWAALLANAMVDGGKRVRRDYFDAVRQLELSDAVLLDIIGRRQHPEPGEMENAHADKVPVDEEALRRCISPNEQAIVMAKLRRLGFLSDNGTWLLMPFGRGLLDACRTV